MIIKTGTWNIGGGKTLLADADPLLMSSYSVDNMDHIVEVLQSENLDLITLQETHKNESFDQVAEIAGRLGMPYFVHDSTSRSHIDPQFDIGHGILSKFDITDHRTGLFENPGLFITLEDGRQEPGMDKGYTTCTVTIEDEPINVTTLHLMPFRRFGVDTRSIVARRIFRNVSRTILESTQHHNWIVQGDFNIDSPELASYLPDLFEDGVHELQLSTPTTPGGTFYDHSIARHALVIKRHVRSNVGTDHYPLITTYELEGI